MNSRGKLWLAVPLFLGGGFFCGWQIYRAFWSAPPQGFYLKTRTSPALNRGPQPDLMWHRFRYLYTEAQREAAAAHRPLASFRLFELDRDPRQAIEWRLDTVSNPGFNPLHNIERNLGNQAQTFVGYYTCDGQPLAYTLKRSPDFPNHTAVTIHLNDPVQPGASLQLLRLDKRTLPVKSPKNNYRLNLDSLPGPHRGIHVRGIRLPDRATIVRYAPAEAFVFTNGHPLIAWINTSLPENTNCALTVTFTCPK
jgi:hypothetical protein